MNNNFEACFKLMLKSEGGFVNNNQDPGGMTNLGVTKATWEAWVGHEVDEKIMRELTSDLVQPLYRKKYWDAIAADDLPSGVDYCVFDVSVNSGPGRAIKLLQSSVGATPDGSIGPITSALIRKTPLEFLIKNYCAKRLEFMRSLKVFETFGKGWTRRVNEVQADALKMIV